MAHDIYWMKPGAVLYVSYKGYQDEESITETLDAMAAEFDSVDHPVVVLINWLEVTDTASGALLAVRGHRAYSHPMAARGVLVGFPRQARFENEVTAIRTRGDKNTQYFDSMDQALDYLKEMLAGT
jgi:hypothetical protein